MAKKAKIERNFQKEDKYFVERVAHFIKSKRRKMRLTQSELAEMFNLNINQIWRMELGNETTKLSTALRIVSKFAKCAEMSPVQFISYMLQIPINIEPTSLSTNEVAIIKAFRQAPAELRRKYAEMSEISNVKFSLALEILTLPAPILKKIVELAKAIEDK